MEENETTTGREVGSIGPGKIRKILDANGA